MVFPENRKGVSAWPGSIDCRFISEPLLVFGDGGQHVAPKAGIARFGPRSFVPGRPGRQHPASVRVGFIGTAETVEKAHAWLETNSEGVDGDSKHPEFPGYRADRGFFSQLEFDDTWVEIISQSELDDLLAVHTSRVRFEMTLGLLETKLRLLAERDQPPQYILLTLPDSLVRRCAVTDYTDGVLGRVHRDLRRAFKAAAMRYRIPTQLLSQKVVDGRDPTHPSKIAWNFFTGLYFKAGGSPWGPVGLQAGTCYVGVNFYQPLGTTYSTIQTSLAQAFDEHGESLVLRGHDFQWDSVKEGSRSPHLSDEQAHELIEMVLARYEAEMKQPPRRVVVYKSSRYWPKEREGFRAALKGRVNRYDLVALEKQSNVRLITVNKYPPLRGTWFSLKNLDYIYTTGFIAALQEYHGMHVPSPLLIADHVGQDTTRETLLKEILVLTKMNWNSAGLGGLLPVPLMFSDLVGSILREVPSDREPLPGFKYYI
jgi:hypothetical protein